MTTRGGFNAACDEYFGQYMRKIEHCVGLLDEDEIWRRPAPGANSIGNLLLHLAGNLSLWVLNSLGGEHNARHRSEEFTAERTLGKEQLIDRLQTVIERCRLNARTISADTLATPLEVQGYATDGMGALF